MVAYQRVNNVAYRRRRTPRLGVAFAGVMSKYRRIGVSDIGWVLFKQSAIFPNN